jgi:hypothetical protein
MRIVTPLLSAGELNPPCKALVPASRRRPGEKIVAALEKAGVEFLEDGQGVRLKPPKAKKGKRE